MDNHKSRKKERTEMVSYRMHVDFRLDESMKQRKLLPGNVYYLGPNEQRATYEDIVFLVSDVINTELVSELQKFIDDDQLEVKVQSVYEGSIEVLFTVAMNALTIASGVHDVIELIAKLSEKFVEKQLNYSYGKCFEVTVYSMPRSHFREPLVLEHKPATFRKDIFFWYLLIMNVVLMVLLGVLVFGAVEQMYFAGV